MIDLDMGGLCNAHGLTSGHRPLDLKRIFLTIHRNDLALRIRTRYVVGSFFTRGGAPDSEGRRRSVT